MEEECSIIFYESPARIRETLEDALDILGDRQVMAARELTKVFEEIREGKISELLAAWPGAGVKGEFTVMLQGAAREPAVLSEREIGEQLLKILSEKGVSLRDAVAEAARRTQMPRKKYTMRRFESAGNFRKGAGPPRFTYCLKSCRHYANPMSK